MEAVYRLDLGLVVKNIYSSSIVLLRGYSLGKIALAKFMNAFNITLHKIPPER